MQAIILLAGVLALAAFAYRSGTRKALAAAGDGRGGRALHSLPSYYGAYVALWCGIPALLIAFVWLIGGGWLAEQAALGTLPEAMTAVDPRSEEHTSELQSLMRISYAVFCLKKKKTK